jgi:anti-sigma factor RsiW
LNCREIIRELSNYLDGDLDASMKQHFEVHLKGCNECAIVVSQTRITVEIFCDSNLVELPSDVRSRVRESLRRKIGECRK